MSKPEVVGSLVQWNQLTQKQLATVYRLITITLRAGTLTVGRPILSLIIKTAGDIFGWINLNEAEVHWLVVNVQPGIRKKFVTKDSNGTVTRSVSAEHVMDTLTEYLKLSSKREDGRYFMVEIPGPCITQFMVDLSVLLYRFRKTVPSLTSKESEETEESESGTTEEEDIGEDDEEQEVTFPAKKNLLIDF